MAIQLINSGSILNDGTGDSMRVGAGKINDNFLEIEQLISSSVVVSDHTALTNIGTNTHPQIDTHIADADIHFTSGSIVITTSQISDYAPTTIPAGTISGSSQISITESQITDLTHYTDADTLAYMNSKAVVSGSVLTSLPSGVVSGSSQISITESQITDLTHYTDADALAYMNSLSVVSGSVVSSYTDLTNIPSGIVSSSFVAYKNVNNNFTSPQTITNSGSAVLTVSGSNGELFKVTDDVANILLEVDDANGQAVFTVTKTGVVSGSAFIGDGSGLTGIAASSLPSGVISGSSQVSITESQITDLSHTVIPTGTVSGSSQITIGDTIGLLSGSRIIGDIQASSVEYTNVLNKPTLISSSLQISITQSQITDLDHYTDADALAYINSIGVVSGSVITSLPSGTVSGSSQITITESQISDLSHTDISHLNTFSGSIQTQVNGLSAVTSSYLTSLPSGLVSGSYVVALPAGTISGSSQVSITESQITDLDHYTDADTLAYINSKAVVSGSVITSLPAGTVSGSSQVSYVGLSNIPVNIVSGSSQLTSSYDARYALSGSGGVTDYTNLTNIPSGILSGSVAASNVILANINGATYTTSQQMQDIYHSTGLVSGGVITDAGSGTVNISAGQGYIRPTDNVLSELKAMGFAGTSGLVLTNVILNYIYVYYNAGTPSIVTSISVLNTNEYLLLGTVYRDGTTLHITPSLSYQVGDHAVQMISRLQGTMPFARESGAVITGAGLYISITAGTFWEGLNKFTTTAHNFAVSGTFSYFYQNGGGGFTEVAGATQINNTQWDNGTGTLATLSNNKYGVHWVYLGSDSDIYVVYGRADYSSLADAQAASVPSNVPAFFNKHVKLVGRAIVLKSATSLASVSSVFTTTFNAGAAATHNSLAGLQGGTVNEYYHLTSAEYGTSVTNLQTTIKTKLDVETVISGSSQLTSSYDTRYETQGRGIVSGSTQITPLLPTDTVSGSSQVSYVGLSNIPAGIVSGSSQVVSILSSLNTYTGSNDTVNTAQNSRLTSLETVTGSLATTYETRGSGIISSSAQITPLLPTGTVSGSSQVSFTTITDKPTLVSGSSQVSYTGLSSIPAGIVSSSFVAYKNINNNFTAGQTIIHSGSNVLTVSGSQGTLFNVSDTSSSNRLTILDAFDGHIFTVDATGSVSASRYIGDGSQLTGLAAATLPSGIVSGSSQITYSGISSIPSGIVSSSFVAYKNVYNNFTAPQQIYSSGSTVFTVSGSVGDLMKVDDTNTGTRVRLNNAGGSSIFTIGDTGIVSASVYQGDGSQLTGIGEFTLPAGVVSGSAQIVPLLPSGVISGSISYTNLDASLKATGSLAGTEVDWNAGIQFEKVLSANTTFTFVNYEVGKTIVLKISGNYTSTFPTGVDATELADYDGTKTNWIQIYCGDKTTPVFLSSLRAR